jgi:hypothetical protein
VTVPTVTLTGRYVAPNGTPQQGSLVFRPQTAMKDILGRTIVPADPITVTLDDDGSFTAQLVPSDAAGMTPDPVDYDVTERFGGNDRYTITIPNSSASIDLADLRILGDAEVVFDGGGPTDVATADGGSPTTSVPATLDGGTAAS